MSKNTEYLPIENYGIIGNMKTVALVSLYGDVDFMCFPNFDSPTVFASLLDKENGGTFSVVPQLSSTKTKQLYMPGTAVLLTRFFSEEGISELTDYMPIEDFDNPSSICSIVRKIKTVRGKITYKVNCAPRFDYAKAQHQIDKTGKNELTFLAIHDGDSMVRLISDFPLRFKGQDGYAEITLNQGEEAWIVLESVKKGETENLRSIDFYKNSTYQETVTFWRKWINKSTYKGRWNDLVSRSAITLKLLTSTTYGSMVAAPTFSLPESLGGSRNWDYRFTWIRDAAFTMYAFLRLGYWEEASSFLHWIEGRSDDKALHLMYSIDGSPVMEEEELQHMEGYMKSRPVRIGNAAKTQLQLDIYGELIDTIYLYNKNHTKINFELWKTVQKHILYVVKNWAKPDHGIWEFRNGTKHYLHTRLMCWVAMDRAIKIAEDRSFPYPEIEWKDIRDKIYLDIYDGFWNENVGAWVQYKGAEGVDASALLMPLVHFITPDEPRWLSTMKVIEERLSTDVLIYRYNNTGDADGIAGEEGTFNMCSFWFIEALAKNKEVSKALEYFEKMAGYANHLGLFSEQIGKRGEHLGNFPQAFTHLALISAALELDKQIDRL
ncbi:glycoside hydrolase family 15 protein [Pedobacter sp. L105]|uniref:glycoside hydrolase family 15 protein n=1 Tax=Pedobacter sp. L105 TaxID=1641871 RepID=UPI00131CB4C9|nr:glycoside hydrolase family 15 protein [Pedobacter sp. L105]